MDLIIDGGTYGKLALDKIRDEGRCIVVIDEDPGCIVQKEYSRGFTISILLIKDSESIHSGLIYYQKKSACGGRPSGRSCREVSHEARILFSSSGEPEK